MSETSVTQRARELLAAEWDKVGRAELAATIRKGREDEWSKAGPALRAIEAALTSTLPGDVRALVERLRRKAQYFPEQGGGTISADGKSTSYITDDGMRLVNPDGPEAADFIESALQGEVREEDVIAWFGKQRDLELYFYCPVYGDDDDQAEEWRVDRQSGPINDREWDTVGRGETPLAAVQSAYDAALSLARPERTENET